LSEFLRQKFRLKPNKTLKFRIVESDVEGESQIYWKVLNRGDEAKRRNCIRGQITPDSGNKKKDEYTSFRGEHRVECYVIKNGVVVAKDRIDVPIE
jgi:Adenylyl/Guanylyl and SMODS C-terminal sensor domain